MCRHGMTPKLHTERPSKHDTFTQCRCAVGPASQTSQMVVQHYNNIGLVSRVFMEMIDLRIILLYTKSGLKMVLKPAFRMFKEHIIDMSLVYRMLSIYTKRYVLLDPVWWDSEVQPLTIAACPSQQARDIQSMLGQRWASIADGGPALSRHRLNVSCLLARCWNWLLYIACPPVLNKEVSIFYHFIELYHSVVLWSFQARDANAMSSIK